ncbi:MAG: hypothetical protein CR988_02230 [Treponema sp.]|nr:MAG: hypothetical protein CR988_02230 [Treponema sp.]
MKENIISKFKTLKGVRLLKLLGIIALTIVFIALGIIFILSQVNKKDETGEPAEVLKSVKIQPNMLWLSDEPLQLPPVQFSREQKKTWLEEDVMEFYFYPNEKTMQELHQKNEEKIKDLLEGTE